jgi:hypothetical protein
MHPCTDKREKREEEKKFTKIASQNFKEHHAAP